MDVDGGRGGIVMEEMDRHGREWTWMEEEEVLLWKRG